MPLNELGAAALAELAALIGCAAVGAEFGLGSFLYGGTAGFLGNDPLFGSFHCRFRQCFDPRPVKLGKIGRLMCNFTLKAENRTQIGGAFDLLDLFSYSASWQTYDKSLDYCEIAFQKE